MSVAYFASLMHMYGCDEFALIYTLKFALDVRPVKVIKNAVNPAASELLADAEPGIRWVPAELRGAEDNARVERRSSSSAGCCCGSRACLPRLPRCPAPDGRLGPGTCGCGFKRGFLAGLPGFCRCTEALERCALILAASLKVFQGSGR